MTFKVGDRVRWTANPEYGVGTVIDPDYNPDGWIAAVRFDDYGEYEDDSDYHAAEIKNLELVETSQDDSDDVNHPAHYNSGKIEVWDFIYDQRLGYALGNATKYISRAGKKAGNSKVKDLRKAIAFLEREIRFEETGE